MKTEIDELDWVDLIALEEYLVKHLNQGAGDKHLTILQRVRSYLRGGIEELYNNL
jgi:hypothetical protein